MNLSIDATPEKLGGLGLSHAALTLKGLLSDAVRSEMPAHAFRTRLPDTERSGREERRVRIETLATGCWIRVSEVVLKLAPPGVGKSNLHRGLGIRAIQLGFSAQYFRFDELLTALSADAHLPPARPKRRKYMSTALLLVDEIGYDPMSRDEASLFFRLVSYRYARGAIGITTNKSIRDWTEQVAGDEVLATAILDHLLHRAHVLNIKGRSQGRRDLEEALRA